MIILTSVIIAFITIPKCEDLYRQISRKWATNDYWGVAQNVGFIGLNLIAPILCYLLLNSIL